MLFTDTITILRPRPKSTRYATEAGAALDYSDPERIPVEALVSVQPSSSTDRSDGRSSTVSGWRLITPAGVDLDLLATDRVEHATGLFSVVGEPLRWPHPIRVGEVHHLEAALQLVTG